MGIESVVPLIAQVGIKLINYFQSRSAQSSTGPKGKIDENTVGRLLEMYSALTKADEQLNLYYRLIMTTSGQPKEILLQNLRGSYFDRIQSYLETFLTLLNSISAVYPQIPDMVKSNSCGAREAFEVQLKKQLEAYTQIYESGGKFSSADIANLIDAFKATTTCYSEGVISSLKAILAHK